MGVLYSRNSHKPNDKDVIDWLLGHNERELTTWELEFLDSIQYRDFLTLRQKETLDRIWEEVVIIGREG